MESVRKSESSLGRQGKRRRDRLLGLFSRSPRTGSPAPKSGRSANTNSGQEQFLEPAQSPEPAHSQALSKSQSTNIKLDEEGNAPQSPDHEIAVTGEDQIQCRDLWKQAYDVLEGREPDLVTDYKRHLAPSDDNTDPLSTPESTRSVVERLSEDREKKQWRLSFQGKDIKFREAAEKLIKILLWSDEIIKPALSTQPYAALAWSGISILLPLLASGSIQTEAMLTGFRSISNLQQYWRICEETYLRPPYSKACEGLAIPLVQLYSYILEYQARVICHLSRRQLERAWQKIAGSNDWDGKRCEIESTSERCRQYIPALEAETVQDRFNRQLQEMEESRTIQDKIRQLLEDTLHQVHSNFQDQKERALLETLSSPPTYEDDKNLNRKRVDGTCEWVFTDERFRKWRDRKTSNFLWVSAGPGCGKSVLSRSLIDEGRLSTSVIASTVCYFFFKDGESSREYSTNALSAILHQLLTRHPNPGLMIEHALSIHKVFGPNLTENFTELWKLLIKCAETPDAGEIICLVDALDECKDATERLIDKLVEFYSQNKNSGSSSLRLKFLITSRPYHNLEKGFRKLSEIGTYMHFDGDDKSDQISKEINLVIDARLPEIVPDLSDANRAVISHRLKSKGNRTYLWLHLIFGIINKSSVYSDSLSVEELLDSLPPEVFGAYEKILGKSEQESHAEILLQMLLAATRPLTLDEVNIALTLATKDKSRTSHDALDKGLWQGTFRSTVKNLCGLFITVHDSKLFFIHQTAREFLLTPPTSGDTASKKWQGRFCMPQAHAVLSQTCLHYLSLGDFTTPTQSNSTEKKQYPFLQYTALNWVLHYTSQESRAANELVEVARRLCNCSGPQLLSKGADINAQSERYGNALQVASAHGHNKIVEQLLGKGADVNTQGGQYSSALQAASAGGHDKIVEQLLGKGADVNAQGGHYGNALQAASACGHYKIVEQLLSKGADVNAQGGWCGNALQAASAGGHDKIIEQLLSKGVDVNAQGGLCGNALQAASASGHDKIVEQLLSKGADVNAQSGWYSNALYGASAGGHNKIVEQLLGKGADVNAQGGHYGNALQAASNHGYDKIVEQLLGKGADVNAQGGYDGNALQAASVRGHYKIVEQLLGKGADVNAQGRYYGNALYVASAGGHDKIVEQLLDKGADVNAQGGYYGNALQAASARGHYKIVEQLLGKGATR